jgi:MerR family redox-sensitive transcriptional activator SoxR
MKNTDNYLSIGEAARRSGVATSTLRFYESRGLIHSIRVSGNHRRYHRAMLRRISIIRIAQTLGLSLREIAGALETLPDQRTPDKKDWTKLSTSWGKQLDLRITRLQNLRDKLSGCIGCGCLSLKKCSLYNADDEAAQLGSGPRYLLGDKPSGD